MASRGSVPEQKPTCPPAGATDAAATAVPGKTRFAVIGDYGSAGENEAKVAALVSGWKPDFVITTGDNNYPSGGADTIDDNIGQFFHDFISPYVGRHGCGASRNRFFPSLGNHDWYTRDARPYRDYFVLPGNERYYDIVIGDVHLFALDSDPQEPDGVTQDSVQAMWLKGRLMTSPARWRVVYMHHPPHSSGPHQSSIYMRWPFKEWGTSIVFAGHDHTYERLSVDGLPFIVEGLGGASLYAEGSPIPGSIAHYDAGFGAVLVVADATTFSTQFFTVEGRMMDQLVLKASP
ncbi:MAG: metallophosphoesterase [Bacteroidota bacterium]